MNKRFWFIPVLIVFVNALAIITGWSTLPDPLPAHFDIQGNASGTMPRCMLLLYLLISAAVCFASYILARKKEKIEKGMIILSSGICLVLLSSTMVSLTSGTVPLFMIDEPIILLASVVAFIVSYKKK